MTKLLEKALETVRRWPPEAQDAIAKMLLLNVGDESEPQDIPTEDLADVLEGLAEADRKEFATDEQVAAAFRRFNRSNSALRHAPSAT